MPLQHSASPQALKANMRTLMGEIGQSPHVQSRNQAIAIALETQRRAKGHAEGGEVGGLVNHDQDPDLPPAQDRAALVPMLPMPQGYHDPAYFGVIQRLLEGQKRLNAMHPLVREQLRRYWIGGLVRAARGGYIR